MKRYPTIGPREAQRRVHRLRAEHALGRPLKGTETVHHADGTVDRDAPLVICPDQAYHMLLHRRMRIVQAGGNPDTESYCSGCKVCKPLGQFWVNATGKVCYRCRVCSKVYNKQRWAAKGGN